MAESLPLWRRLYQGWLHVTARFAEVQTLVLVTLVYGLALGPAALVAGGLRSDLLHKRGLRQGDSAWLEADSVTEPDLERAKRFF